MGIRCCHHVKISKFKAYLGLKEGKFDKKEIGLVKIYNLYKKAKY